MNQLSICKILIIDILSSNFLLSTSSELILRVVKYTGNYCTAITMLCVLFALFLIGSINYAIGVICYRCYISFENITSLQRYNMLMHLYSKYLFIIMFLVPLPIIGQTITFATGFLRTSYIRSMLLFVAVKTIYYLSPLFE